jgi:DNA oxidative demethylase
MTDAVAEFHCLRTAEAGHRKHVTKLPPGFRYIPEFLSEAEERELLRRIVAVPFADVRMHGVAAKRRVIHFGWIYGYESSQLTPGPPVPDWLLPLRERAGMLIKAPADDLEEILITQYPPGAGIGWHRDAPMFGPDVIGVSLLGACRFRFRRRLGELHEITECTMEPRSAYVLGVPARVDWQHAILPIKTLRYSLTFRTVKATQHRLPANSRKSYS